MNTGLISSDIRVESTVVPVEDVIVRVRQRPVDEAHVAAIQKSFTELGGQLQLQPIVLDGGNVLIDGAHRLAAAKLAGWTHIRAVVFHGATDEDRGLLELEANLVRKNLSVVEIEEAWRKFYEPVWAARAKENRARGVENLRQGPDVPVIGNSNNREIPALVTGDSSNRETGEHVSLSAAAKAVTGKSLDTLNKVTDIRQLAESSTAPADLREAAQRGLAKLEQPGTSVEQVHKKLLRMQEINRRAGEDPTEAHLRDLEKRLDQTLTETSLLAERLGGVLGSSLLEAAGVSQMSAETLRGIRVSLTHALAAIVVVECRTNPDPAGRLNQIGGEATRMLSERCMAGLQQAQSEGEVPA